MEPIKPPGLDDGQFDDATRQLLFERGLHNYPTLRAKLPDEEPEDEAGFEVIVDAPDFQPVAVLNRAVQQAGSVGRVVLPNGFGTGSLIGPDLLLTNAHVLPNAEVAAESTVQFNFVQVDLNGDPVGEIDEYEFDPKVFFSSPFREQRDGGVDKDHLDYAVVGVKRKGRKSASKKWGVTNVADKARQWFGVGHDVFIVQHPEGAPKAVSLARNEIVLVGDIVFYYLTDTLPGSSGSAVVDQTWKMVGLHHAGGRWNVDGRRFVANEAINVWAVFADLERKREQA